MKTFLRSLALVLLFCTPSHATPPFSADTIINQSIGTSTSAQHAWPTGTGAVCTTDATQTLTNKTINYSQAINAGSTSIPLVSLENSTAATAGQSQSSPSVNLIGRGWRTGDLTSQTITCTLRNQPVNGSTIDPFVYLACTNSTAGSLTNLVVLGANATGTPYVSSDFALTGIYFVNGAGDGLIVSSGAASLSVAGSAVFQATSAAYFPAADGQKTEGTPSKRWNRHFLGSTSTVTSSSFVLSSGWGSTASVSAITGSDNGVRFTVTASGSGIGASPTIAYTFKDGTWTNAPMCLTLLETTSDGTVTAPWVTDSTTAIVDTVTFHATPVTAQTYQFQLQCDGRT
jgi:hypothetical protein